MNRTDADLTILREMMSGGGVLVWIVVIGLFVTLLFRRESIVSVGLFRLGVVFFIVSIVGPQMFNAAWFMIVGPSVYPASPQMRISILLAVVGPACLGIGLFCIFSSLLPRRSFIRSEVSLPPQKHPLD